MGTYVFRENRRGIVTPLQVICLPGVKMVSGILDSLEHIYMRCMSAPAVTDDFGDVIVVGRWS